MELANLRQTIQRLTEEQTDVKTSNANMTRTRLGILIGQLTANVSWQWQNTPPEQPPLTLSPL